MNGFVVFLNISIITAQNYMILSSIDRFNDSFTIQNIQTLHLKGFLGL